MTQGDCLDLDELIRLRVSARRLELGARRQALSTQSGGYLSAWRGRGMEFDEVRAYQQTDDARTIDWRVTARRGKPHTKLFREERERPVLLFVDMHSGMFFGSRQQYKFVLAGRLAALLGWAAVRAGDRVGGVVCSAQGHREILPASREHGLLPLLRATVSLQPEEADHIVQGRMDTALARLVRLARPGSLIFILSDFREMGDTADSLLGSLARHNDVIAAHLYDPLEAGAPQAGRYRMSSGGSNFTVNTQRGTVIQRWQDQFRDHSDAVKKICRRHALHYMQVSTIDKPVHALQIGLARHKGLA